MKTELKTDNAKKFTESLFQYVKDKILPTYIQKEDRSQKRRSGGGMPIPSPFILYYFDSSLGKRVYKNSDGFEICDFKIMLCCNYCDFYLSIIYADHNPHDPDGDITINWLQTMGPRFILNSDDDDDVPCNVISLCNFTDAIAMYIPYQYDETTVLYLSNFVKDIFYDDGIEPNSMPWKLLRVFELSKYYNLGTYICEMNKNLINNNKFTRELQSQKIGKILAINQEDECPPAYIVQSTPINSTLLDIKKEINLISSFFEQTEFNLKILNIIVVISFVLNIILNILVK